MMTAKSINNIGLCLALMASTAACSTDNTDMPQTPAPPITLSLSCGVGAETGKPDTRATVDYGTASNGESFKWNTGDSFGAYLFNTTGSTWETNPASFAIDDAYADKSSNKADFIGTFAAAGTYQLLALYPSNPATGTPIFTADPGTSGKYNFSLSATEQTQLDKSSDHLKNYMLMWAKTANPVTVSATPGNNAPGLGFHHLTTMLRFTVTNKSNATYRVTKITVTAVGTDDAAKVFGTVGSITQDATSWATAPVIAYDASKRINTVTINTQNEEKEGVLLSKPKDKNHILHAYLLTLPGADLTDRKLTFALTATDDDGSHEHTYISPEFDANRLISDAANSANAKAWQPGMRYWFSIDLNDALTVTGATIAPWTERTGDMDLTPDAPAKP